MQIDCEVMNTKTVFVRNLLSGPGLDALTGDKFHLVDGLKHKRNSMTGKSNSKKRNSTDGGKNKSLD